MRRTKISRKRKKIVKNAVCPKCKTNVACKGLPGQKIIVKCPNCSERGMVVLPKESEHKILKIRLHIPKKITITRIILIISSFIITATLISLLFITSSGRRLFIDTIIVAMFIGIMIAREIAEDYMTIRFKKKINIFTGLLTIAFFGVVVNEIIGFISR